MANPQGRQSLKKHRTHARIVASASRIARTEGLAAASVSRVMHGAGLTVGGFYAHFRSKHAMDAEVVEATLGDTSTPWSVERYLTTTHRDNVRRGCAFPALVSEIARADRRTRTALARAVERRAGELAAATPGLSAGVARERALASLALCIGGLALARAMRGNAASNEILAACRKWAASTGSGSRARSHR